MNSKTLEELAQRLQERRGGMGIRETAKAIGISPATLSRVENQKIPDLDTFGKICKWLGDDPAIYLGLPQRAANAPQAQVHFKKGGAIEADSAEALAKMILLVQDAIRKEDNAF